MDFGPILTLLPQTSEDSIWFVRRNSFIFRNSSLEGLEDEVIVVIEGEVPDEVEGELLRVIWTEEMPSPTSQTSILTPPDPRDCPLGREE